jgi:hypothetical protein
MSISIDQLSHTPFLTEENSQLVPQPIEEEEGYLEDKPETKEGQSRDYSMTVEELARRVRPNSNDLEIFERTQVAEGFPLLSVKLEETLDALGSVKNLEELQAVEQHHYSLTRNWNDILRRASPDQRNRLVDLSLLYTQKHEEMRQKIGSTMLGTIELDVGNADGWDKEEQKITPQQIQEQQDALKPYILNVQAFISDLRSQKPFEEKLNQGQSFVQELQAKLTNQNLSKEERRFVEATLADLKGTLELLGIEKEEVERLFVRIQGKIDQIAEKIKTVLELANGSKRAAYTLSLLEELSIFNAELLQLQEEINANNEGMVLAIQRGGKEQFNKTSASALEIKSLLEEAKKNIADKLVKQVIEAPIFREGMFRKGIMTEFGRELDLKRSIQEIEDLLGRELFSEGGKLQIQDHLQALNTQLAKLQESTRKGPEERSTFRDSMAKMREKLEGKN